ncbi:MAG: hypothetical protein ACTTH8_07875, partial [Treponema sp.]
MKKIVPFFTAAVIVCLFAGCPLTSPKPKTEDADREKTTRLTINNQSQAEFVYNIKVDGGYKPITIQSGNSCTAELRKGINGYIHFEVSWSDYSYIPDSYAQGIRKDVRTHELIVLETGTHKTITITDNTLVVPKGGTAAMTIADLKPSVLSVKLDFATDYRPSNISYNGITRKCNYSGDCWIVCDGSAEDVIKFDFLNLPVQTLEKVSLEKGKARNLVMNDNTDITIYDKNYTVKKLEKLHILTITNNSSAVIKDLLYRDYETNDLYERNLEKGKQCSLASYRFYDKYDSPPDLVFTLITKTGKELKA